MLFLRVNKVAVQLFCIALFCFVFLAHSTHDSTAKTAKLSPTPSNVSTSAINNSSAVVLKSARSSSFIPTKSVVSITNTAIPIHTSVVPQTFKPPHTTAKHMLKDTGRKFDGLSFFGGMILGAVVCIVLLFSVKYYQAKKRSYHSL